MNVVAVFCWPFVNLVCMGDEKKDIFEIRLLLRGHSRIKGFTLHCLEFVLTGTCRSGGVTYRLTSVSVSSRFPVSASGVLRKHVASIGYNNVR